MDIIEKAKELGTMIADSAQMNRYKDAEQALEQDDRAKDMLNEYKNLQSEVVKTLREDTEENIINSMREKLRLKMEDMNNYHITKEYFEAKSSFDRFIKTVNNVIMYSITGEEPCSSHGCGSCGGCG